MTDYNDAGNQRTFELIPDRTVVPVQLTVRPGNVGEGGWLSRSKDGHSEGLDCEFTVTDGDYAKRKFWTRFTVDGTTPGHTEAADISRRTLRAILESARGIRPDDQSEDAKKARVAVYGDFNGLRFLVRVGVQPPRDGYPAKNILREVITPDRREWTAIDQGSKPAVPTVPAASPKPEWAQ
jgi:hypothetical protein